MSSPQNGTEMPRIKGDFAEVQQRFPTLLCWDSV